MSVDAANNVASVDLWTRSRNEASGPNLSACRLLLCILIFFLSTFAYLVRLRVCSCVGQVCVCVCVCVCVRGGGGVLKRPVT